MTSEMTKNMIESIHVNKNDTFVKPMSGNLKFGTGNIVVSSFSSAPTTAEKANIESFEAKLAD